MESSKWSIHYVLDNRYAGHQG